MRLSATSALLSRRDVIVVASVSCIYGVTSPEDYERMLLTVKRGQQISREAVLGRLVDMLYERNDMNFSRGRFRVRGDVVEVYPATADEEAIRIEFFGDEIDAITRFDPLTGHAHEALRHDHIFPGETIRHAGGQTESRADHDSGRTGRTASSCSKSQGKLLEAQRLRKCAPNTISRCCRRWDSATGSRIIRGILSGRPPGSKPYTLLDFFPKDFLLVIDESHATIPQIGGMYEGDRRAKPCWSNTDSACRARSITGR